MHIYISFSFRFITNELLKVIIIWQKTVFICFEFGLKPLLNHFASFTKLSVR